MRRSTLLFLLLALASLSTFAQSGSGWRTAADIGEGARGAIAGTVIDVDEGNRRLQIEVDQDSSRITIETDAVSTQYNGFGSMIAGKPEIFIGSKGFSNLRLGDRVEVRGTGRGRGTLVAENVTLLGRSVEAPQVGVGDTRSPSSATTQIDRAPTGTARQTTNTTEGTVRQINADEGRIVIQTPQRRLITVRAYRNTPVYYRNEVFRISNLEVGDRIRVTADPRDSGNGEITASRIDVVQGVQDGDTTTPSGGTVTVIAGRVTRVDAALNYVWVATRDDEVRVDMSRAEDESGKRIGARDLRSGEEVEVLGSFDRVGDIFLASTVRFERGTGGTPRRDDDFARYFGVVTINGTIVETLDEETTIGVRDRTTNRVLRLWVTDDFIVRLKNGTTTTADKLRGEDSVRVKAFQDASGNLVAQTITLRNR